MSIFLTLAGVILVTIMPFILVAIIPLSYFENVDEKKAEKNAFVSNRDKSIVSTVDNTVVTFESESESEEVGSWINKNIQVSSRTIPSNSHNIPDHQKCNSVRRSSNNLKDILLMLGLERQVFNRNSPPDKRLRRRSSFISRR